MEITRIPKPIFNRCDVYVISYLLENEKGTSREIERGMNLRQPQVSTSLRKLFELEITNEDTILRKEKGRPEKIITFDKINAIGIMVDTINKDIKKKQKLVDKLKLL